MSYKVFLISPEKTNRYHYYENDLRYNRVNGLWWEDINLDNYSYNFRWNAGEKHRKCNIAIQENHLSVMRNIVENDLKNVFIVEDDAELEFERIPKFLEELETSDLRGLIYVGGGIVQQDITMNKSTKVSINRDIQLKDGFNRVDRSKFNVLGAHGIFIRDKLVAQTIIDLFKKRNRAAIDFSYAKINIDRHLYYPALSILRDLPSTYVKGKKTNSNNQRYYGIK